MMEIMNEEKNRSFLNMNSHTNYGFAQEKRIKFGCCVYNDPKFKIKDKPF